MNIGHCSYGAKHIPVGCFPNMANKTHVLLVEHDNKDHDKIIDMLKYFCYEVTSVNLASTALSILSKEKVQYDIVIANLNSPDSYGFQLLQVATQMDLLVMLMSNEDDAPTTMRALEQGAFLCIKKPVTMQILAYLWQHVSREKLCRLKENEPLTKVIQYNPKAKEFGEDDHMEGNEENDVKHESNKKGNLGTSENDSVVFKRKVWTEWTVELHGKFMDAAKKLGHGRCYPKDILELMNVPGLTRMQVASHLQKCRNAKWLPPDKRKSRQPKTETTTPQEKKLPRSKTVKFGSMPFVDETNHEATVVGLSRAESSDSGYYPLLLLDERVIPLGEDDAAFKGGQTFSMDQHLVYGGPSTAPLTNVSEEDAFEIPIMDHNYSQGGMDYNGSWHSLVLEHEESYDQISTGNNGCLNN